MLDRKQFIGGENLTIIEAMQKINDNSKGIIFIVDSDNKLLGCVTDGDIRRYLVSGGTINSPVLSSANKNPRIAKSLEEAIRLYHPNFYRVIPVVDDQGVIEEFYYQEDDYTLNCKESICIPVVINAGGKGKRLDPFTRVLPKPLIPIGDHPIIELIMKEYKSYGCNLFHIILNYKKDLIKAYFTDSECDYDIIWYDEYAPLGTGGGLGLLRGKINSTFFFTNCDVLLMADYEKIIQFHKEKKNVITMICAQKNIHIPYGVVDTDVCGQIINMKEKPSINFLVNTGIYIVEPEVIDDIADNENIGFPDVIEREINKNKRVAVYTINENDWMDMGQLPELETMRTKYERF